MVQFGILMVLQTGVKYLGMILLFLNILKKCMIMSMVEIKRYK